MTPNNNPKVGPYQKRVRTPMRLSNVYEAPGHLIRRAQQIAVAIFFDEFEGWEVTPVQYAALVAIRDYPGMDQMMLVNCIAIDRSTAGSMLGVLERRGLISRIVPKDNMRVKRLYIEKAGIDLLNATQTLIQNVQMRILEPLQPEEQHIFLEFLTRIVDINNELSRAPLRVGATSPRPPS